MKTFLHSETSTVWKIVKNYFLLFLMMLGLSLPAFADWNFDPSKHISNFTIDRMTHKASFKIIIVRDDQNNDQNLRRAKVYINETLYFSIYNEEDYGTEYSSCNYYFSTHPDQKEENFGIRFENGMIDNIQVMYEQVDNFKYATFYFNINENDLFKNIYYLQFKDIDYDDTDPDYHGDHTTGNIDGWTEIKISAFNASTNNCSAITLNWQYESSFPNDVFCRIKNSNDEIIFSGQGVTSYVDYLGQPEAKNYTYKLEVGYGAKFVQVKTGEATGSPPHSGYQDPSGVSVTNHTCKEIKLTWNKESGGSAAEKYYISWDGGDAEVGKEQNTFSITSGIENKSYTLKIQAVNQCGFKSSGVSVTSNPNLPTKPSWLSVTPNNSKNTIELSWASSSYHDKYKIERTSSSNTIFINDLDKNKTSYTDSGVAGCQTYTYKVIAINQCTTDGVPSVSKSGRLQPNISTTFNSSKRVRASKGYYNDNVTLAWDYDNENIIETFKIYRRDLPSGSFKLLETVDPTTSYVDKTAIPGKYYEYMVVGQTSCENDILKTPEDNYSKDVGFCVQRGIVSGNVSFKNKTGVKGVHVIAETEDKFSSTSLYLQNSSSNVRVPNNSNINYAEEFTFQAWVLPNSTNTAQLFSKGTQYQIYHQPNRVTFVANGQSLSLDFQQKVDTFFCVNAVRDPDSLYIYIVYNELEVYKASAKRNITTPDNTNDIYIGGTSNAFIGWMDDIRIWNKALNPQQVVDYSVQYLSGSESGLKIYYHLDEMFYSNVYDISRNGSVFNENHGVVSGGLLSDVIPLKRQLAVKGITDINGNYIISNIPYTLGSIYKIVPVFEMHEFSPTQKQLFIGPGSSTHNDINFEDIAAFKVTGTVYYKNTNFPVKDVNIYVDGQVIIQENGRPVATDEQGKYEVYVPIGWHYISVGKTGHAFVDEGRYPKEGKKNFQAPINGVNFIDSTLIKVIGRCAGGPVEAEKKLGLGHTKNNLGNAEILLTTEKGYDLSISQADSNGVWPNTYLKGENDETFGNTLFSVKSTSKENISINPDPNTGEFVAYLLPEKYKVLNITAGQYTYPESAKVTIDLSNAYQDNEEVDSVLVGYDAITGPVYRVDKCFYNEKKEFIYRTEPEIDVFNANDNSRVFWEKEYTTQDGETINIVDADGNPLTLHPILKQLNPYKLLIKVFERYINVDNNNAEDLVPVKDGRVEVQNFLAINRNKMQLYLNDSGEVVYSFTGGLPNVTTSANEEESYTLTMGITALTGPNGAIQTDWKPNGKVFRAYLLGGMPTGNNFVTTGPNEIDMILRDPPGSGSYTYLEKGTTTTITKSYNLTNSLGGSIGINKQIGKNQTILIGGVGGGKIETIDVKHDITAGISINKEWVKEGQSVESVTNIEKWSTSSSSDFVGAEGDVFIGHSTNIVYGLSYFVDLTPTDKGEGHVGPELNGLKIGKTTGIRVNPEFNTAFIYTQKHITEYLIPNLKYLRNQLLIQDNKYHYTSMLPVNDPNFGKDNDAATIREEYYPEGKKIIGDSYSYFIPADWPKDSAFTDSVKFYNQQIKSWEKILADNEKEKLEAKQLKNISFDAGSTYESSQTISTTISETRSHTFSISESLAISSGVEISGFGFNLNLEETYSHSKTTSDGTEENNYTTFGYVLADENEGDYISIDVKEGERPFSPIFIKRGGQTMCPYEDVEKTKYYKPGTVISEATMKRESPRLSCDDPIAEAIPADEPAFFNLKIQNISETREDSWFQLIVDEASSQQGALIEMDGSPIGNGRLIYVPGHTTVNKVITLKKILNDVYDYEDIKLILRSTCQESIGDTISITAHFLPICTPVTLNLPLDNWIVNTQGDTTLLCVISDYDLNSITFNSVSLQYKAESDQIWTTAMNFFVNESDYQSANEPKMLLTDSKASYSIPMHDLPDRTYIIQAISNCTDGTHNFSEPAYGIKDVKQPKPFGSPQPADGILSPGDEVLVTFDEHINPATLITRNFSVRGSLNKSELKHEACLFFDGVNDYATALSGVNLDNKSWTIEFWVRRGDSQPGAIFAQNQIELGFDQSDKFYARFNNQTITSSTVISDLQTWYHVAVTYDYASKTSNIYINDIIDREAIPVTAEFKANGKLYIGKSIDGSSKFNGFIHELRVWEKPLGFATLYSMVYTKLVGNEIGLSSYWPMDEANGVLAADKSRNRHLSLYGAEWRVFPTGYAVDLKSGGYMTLPGNNIAFSELNNFTVEFYFKGGKQTNAVLFSNGRGDGTDYSPRTDYIWNIGFDAAGKLYAKNNGNVILADVDVLDDKWHHLALIVNRAANTQLLVDGKLVAQKSSAEFGGMAAANFCFGAEQYLAAGAPYAYDKHFNGSMDEIRVWNLARTVKQIELDMNSKLMGTEMGLVAYVPFDKYDALGTELIPSTVEVVDGNIDISTTSCELANVDVPNIKDVRPVKNLNFDWSVYENQLLINIKEQPATIEKCIIEFTVEDIQDMHKNRLASPITWTAYVNKNAVVWGDYEVNLEKHVNEPLEFSVKIMNLGGTQQNYTITGLPSWLTTDDAKGSLSPLSEKTIKFTVNPVLNIGDYAPTIYLTSDFGYAEKLNVNLNVYKEAPDWNVDTDKYQYSMGVVGKLKINESFSTNPNDMIAAFVGDECRGVAKSSYVKDLDTYLVFLTINSNQQSGEKVTFRIWNASEGLEHTDVTPDLTFNYNDIVGTISEPLIFETNSNTKFTQPISEGWNWISFNTYSQNLSSVPAMLSSLSFTNGDQVKSQSAFASYSPSYGWYGSLNSIGFNNKEMYMLKLAKSGTLTYSGSRLSPINIPIPIVKGWNWVGYTPSVNMTVNDALANIDPAAGDVIKSQTQFAVYDPNLGWVGNLTYMVPGRGYMFRTQADIDYLIYPESGLSKGNGTKMANKSTVECPWSFESFKYPGNMSVIAEVLVNDFATDSLIVGAFVNQECRGWAYPTKVNNRYLYFLTIQGEDKENVEFKLFGVKSGYVYEVDEGLSLDLNSVVGNLVSPYPINLIANSAGIEFSDSYPSIKIHPNPFINEVTFSFAGLEPKQSMNMIVYSSTGQPVFKKENISAEKFVWNGTDFNGNKIVPGIYLVRFTINGIAKTFKLVKY